MPVLIELGVQHAEQRKLLLIEGSWFHAIGNRAVPFKLNEDMAIKKARILKKTLVKNCVSTNTYTFKISEPIAHETAKAYGFITREPKEKFWLPKAIATVERYTNAETGRTWLTVTMPGWFYDRNIEAIARL